MADRSAGNRLPGLPYIEVAAVIQLHPCRNLKSFFRMICFLIE
jgi:hypothetical protein